MTQFSVAAVICAAGASARMEGSKKEYRPLPGSTEGLTVLGAAVSAFASIPEITSIVITVPEDAPLGDAEARNALPPKLLEEKGTLIQFVSGGKTRQDSVYNALLSLAASSVNFVLIHDGARPWVSISIINQIIDAVQKHHAAIPLLPLVETPKETDAPLDTFMNSANTGSVFIKHHLRRSVTGTAQTPQGFAFPEILAAHRQAASQNISFTDDAEIWASFYGPVAVIPGEPENRKITFAEDLC
ncbi:MAG: 2-C-methyl-D-erythritol 4-phosphate cytidylyltransferase [Treponema sp.]|nr:2-C-methyl-D-erythritol 4-phosphate cytidylyltransferase [Treponema sp.]